MLTLHRCNAKLEIERQVQISLLILSMLDQQFLPMESLLAIRNVSKTFQHTMDRCYLISPVPNLVQGKMITTSYLYYRVTN